MPEQAVLNVDLADVWKERGRKAYLRTIGWGDEITVVKQAATYLEASITVFREKPDGSILPESITGYIEPTKTSRITIADLTRPVADNRVLKVNFVDVQQGDGMVVESPDGKIILIDGGDNQMFARYLAGRFRNTSLQEPKEIDCLVITHGDADHFSGLNEILKSETNKVKRKRLFMQPQRIYHNGIVKRPSTKNNRSVPDSKLLGPTKSVDGRLFLTGLEENLLEVDDKEMNQPFKKWKQTLTTYNGRGPLSFRRLQLGDNQAFEFFNRDDLRIDVLGPITTDVGGTPALRFLGEPPTGPRIGHDSLNDSDEGFTGHSASHTINGHSIVLRLSYGGFSFLFSGDLNDEASRFLAHEHNKGTLNLRSEVFKVPHHGSADFSGAFMQAVSPIVSVVSSGDENARKEYIHPRATLMGALGKWSRVQEPLIFATELVAFFEEEGLSRLQDDTKARKRGPFYGFSRTAYGLVKTRTDGRRLFVYTDSGNVQMKEAYAYQLDSSGVPQPVKVTRV
ncbi:MAG: MBL fold metallo-hydrolase [Nitrospira sp. CR1.2]|nr:MBL fold metallo-hydrolase [Nitrospira sp. CR1.2]